MLTEPRRRLELPIVFLALAAIDLLQMFATHSRDLFTHPLWLDEVLTATLANDPGFSHMLAAIRGGVETNPPAMYMLLWPIAKLFGPLNNFELRAISMFTMLVALTLLYAITRRSFSRSAAAIGVLVVASHPLIISLTYEARFYALWLALTLGLILAIIRNDEQSNRIRQITIYILAIAVATVHWFGVVGIALITAWDFAANRRKRCLAPFAIAMIAVIACLPFYFGQRAGLSVKTWIDPLNASDLRDGLVALFGPPSLLFVMIFSAVVAMTAMRRSTTDIDSALKPVGFSPESTTLFALLLFPPILIAFSIAIQPAFVQRYLVLTTAPLALIAAYSARHLTNRKLIAFTTIALLAIGSAELISKSHAARGLDAGFTETLAAIRTRTRNEDLIVFKRRREMYPVLRLDPMLNGQAVQLDFGDNISPLITAMSLYERDMARKVIRFYPQFAEMKMQALRERNGSVFIVTPNEELAELRGMLSPDFMIEASDDMLHALRRVSSAAERENGEREHDAVVQAVRDH